MNRPILILVLGYITGIIIGLYCKISVVLLCLLFLPILYCIKILILKNKKVKKYYKLIIKNKLIVLFVVASIISCITVKYLNKHYETIYKLETKGEFVATVISNPVKKEYYTQYKIRIDKSTKKELNNSTIFLNIKENIELDYGEKISFFGEYNSPEVREKL